MGTWDFAQWGLCSNVTPLATNRPKCPSTSCEYFIARDICNLQERLKSCPRILCINLFVYFLFCPGFPLRCFFQFFLLQLLGIPWKKNDETFWLKSHLKRLGWPIRYWTNSAAELFAASCGVAVSQRPDLGRGESRKMKIEVRADVFLKVQVLQLTPNYFGKLKQTPWDISLASASAVNLGLKKS